jgi:hypothetical protein
MPPPPNLAELLERRIFPGMSQRETRILQSWMRVHGSEWDSLDVEGRLGAGKLLAPHFSDKERTDWYQRTRARPDCICKRPPNVVLIVEAKELATNEAIWQVLGYRDLYKAEFPNDVVATCVVCEEAHPNAVTVGRGQGVQILRYVIPPDEPLAPGAEAPAS